MLFWLLLLFRAKIILEINKLISADIFHAKNHCKRPLTTLFDYFMHYTMLFIAGFLLSLFHLIIYMGVQTPTSFRARKFCRL